MANIAVPAGHRVLITSTKEANALQRFVVWRQALPDPTLIQLDEVWAGGSCDYAPLQTSSFYVISCQSAYSGQPWQQSREIVSFKDDFRTAVIKCEDYFSTDNDWNDLVVTVTMGLPSNGLWEIKRHCPNAPLPTGWIKIDDEWSSTDCGSPPNYTLNRWIIQRYDNLSTGTIIHVCAGSPVPIGWKVVVPPYFSSTGCGKPITPSIQNMMGIQRI